jgi:ferredoxin
MARSFVTDEGVNSLLFFVVFFFHMLIPLMMAVLLWLHITRLSRPQFLTGTVMTLWVLGSLVVLSVVHPADLAAPARMAALPVAFEMDWWYLAPLAVAERLGGGAAWAAMLAGGVLVLSVPWTLGRGRARTARVIVRRCNACQKCYQDCPYAAISMVPRSDGSPRHTLQASVDPARCVGCGICAGSCDTAGVGLEWFSVGDQRRRLAIWLKRAVEAGEKLDVAFLCGEAAGGDLAVEPATGTCPELPGYLVLQVPCAGWLHPFGIEHSLRFGGRGVLVVACASCRYREGARWEQLRLEGQREPALRTEKVDRERVRLLFLDRTQPQELFREARLFREASGPGGRGAAPRALASLAAAVLAALLAGIVGLVSDLGYAAPRPPGSELVVTFRHPGQVTENCRDLTEEEIASLPVHMRKPRVCDRARSPVRLRVELDDRRVVDAAFPPSGIWGDGSSVALERLPVDVGEHVVRVQIADGPDPEAWQYATEQVLEFTGDARRVLVFDRASGFTWY